MLAMSVNRVIFNCFTVCRLQRSAVLYKRLAPTHNFSTDGAHIQENLFTEIEAENTSKIFKVRAKDLPQNDLSNPYEKEKPKCILCQLSINPDFKNVRLLSQFVSPYTGRIYGRHITGLCKAKQKVVEEEIKKAQSCGLMATMLKDVAFLKDPKLYNPEKPIRPHRF